MVSYNKRIEQYESMLISYELDLFDIEKALYLRSDLEKYFSKMNKEEQLHLLNADLEVIKNAAKLSDYITELREDTNVEIIQTDWWWYLDKVIADKYCELKIQPMLKRVNNAESVNRTHKKKTEFKVKKVTTSESKQVIELKQLLKKYYESRLFN